MTVWFDDDRGKWRYDFRRRKKRYHGYCTHPDGRPAASESEAEDIETLKRAGVIQAERQGDISAQGGRSYSLAQAVAARTVIATRLKSWPVTRDYLREILGHFGRDTALATITAPRIQDYVTWGLKQPVKIWMGGPRKADKAARRAGGKPLQKMLKRTRGPKTMNKYLSALNQVLELAHNTVDPATANTSHPTRLLPVMPEVPFLDVPKRKPRPIPLTGLATLWRSAPVHLQHFIIGTQLTQLRESELLRLETAALDETENGLWLDHHNKSNREDFIPLGPQGMAFFRMLRARALKAGQTHFILYDDPKTGKLRPIASVSKSFQTQLRTAGLQGHRLHQTKTTALSQLRRLGTDPATLQDMARHADFATTKAHYLGEETESRREAITKYEATLSGAGMLATLVPKAARKRTKAKAHSGVVPHAASTRAAGRKRA